MTDEGETIEPVPLHRRGTIDCMRISGRRSNVHGLVKLDVTEARRRIRDRGVETGERVSFTAFYVHCMASAIDEGPGLQAYRDWRGRLVVFDDVDVMVMVETTVGGDRMGVPYVIRGGIDGRYNRSTSRSERYKGTRRRVSNLERRH